MQNQEYQIVSMKKKILYLSVLLFLSNLTIIFLVSCKTIDTEKPYIYTVQSGDTLYHISKISGLSVQKIKDYNNLKNENINSGQILLLPGIQNINQGKKLQQLDIIQRNVWGAMKAGEMTPSKGFNKITIHHTSEKKDSYKRNDIHFIQTIQKFHIKTRKWADIGYHYIIGKDGKIYEGRLLSYYGAHVKNNNTANIGIALLGNLNDNQLNSNQKNSLLSLINALRERYKIPPKALFAHRELGKTSCPGEHTMTFLNQIR